MSSGLTKYNRECFENIFTDSTFGLVSNFLCTAVKNGLELLPICANNNPFL